MKIFVVCNSLGAGGAERVGVNLANGFAHHGHEVYVITDIYQDVAYPVDEKVKVLPMNKQKCGKLKKYMQAISNIRAYAKAYQPDVVIGMMHLASFLPLLALMGMKVPVVLTIHHALTSVGFKRPLSTKIIDRISPVLYSHTTVLTQIDLNILRKYTKKLSVMPNPLTFDTIECLPAKEKVVLAAGRINDWHCKGFDILMQAWNRVAPKYPEWKLRLAGKGSEKTLEFLKSFLTDAMAQKNTEFLGYCKDMKELYRRASVYALSSRSEGLPMVLIEAMSQGCAPVATANMGRTAEIVTSDAEGLICRAEDVDDLAEKLEKLMANHELRYDIQYHAIERSKFYSQVNIVSMWEELLRKQRIRNR